MKKLISYIVPCYNGAGTIHRLLDSFLQQTYQNLEVIVIDDGSTDNSADVIESYRSRFESIGMKLVYFYQQNKGLGGAIDSGLKLFHGEYLCWIDVDDFLAPESSMLRAKYLEDHPEYSVVTSDAYIVKEGELSTPVRRASEGISNNSDENQFWHMLQSNTIFCSGCHMVRGADFLKVNPQRSIFPARRGQNWQLLLPMYYSFKRAFINEPLFYYVIMPNSMSRDNDDLEKELFRCDEHLEIIYETLARIEMTAEDRAKAERYLQRFYARKKLYIAGKNGMRDLAKEQYGKLKHLGENSKKDFIQLLCARNRLIRKLYLVR